MTSSALAIAGPTAGPLPPTVTTIVSGGRWDTGTEHGGYRFVVENRAPAPLGSAVRIEWLAERPGDPSPHVIAAVEIAELSDESCNVGPLRVVNARAAALLEVTCNASGRTRTARFELGAPGIYRIRGGWPKARSAPALVFGGASCFVSLASGTAWTAHSEGPAGASGMARAGPAQPVCLNPGAPANCPRDAVSYGYPAGAWLADLTAVGNAVWIWTPGVSPTDPADLARAVFTRNFELPVRAIGKLFVAADDFAEVKVNGHLVGMTGSVDDISAASSAQSKLSSFDLTPFLVVGANAVTVAAQNGPARFAGRCSGACSYAQNPAGLLLGGAVMCP